MIRYALFGLVLLSLCSCNLTAQAQEVTRVLQDLRANGTITEEQFQILSNALSYNWRQAFGDFADAAVAAVLAYFGLNKLPFLRRPQPAPQVPA